MIIRTSLAPSLGPPAAAWWHWAPCRGCWPAPVSSHSAPGCPERAWMCTGNADKCLHHSHQVIIIYTSNSILNMQKTFWCISMEKYIITVMEMLQNLSTCYWQTEIIHSINRKQVSMKLGCVFLYLTWVHPACVGSALRPACGCRCLHFWSSQNVSSLPPSTLTVTWMDREKYCWQPTRRQKRHQMI